MAKSKKSSSTTPKRTPKKAPAALGGTNVRRTKATAAESRSPLKDVLIIAALALGVFLLVNLFANGDDQGSGEEAVAPDEQSRTEDTDQESQSPTGEDANGATGQADGPLVSETDQAYSFRVDDGESYTTMARRAVASLDGGLSAAERVAAETKLAQDSGGEWLSSGQNLTLSKDDVRSAIDWAKSLDDQQKAAWQPYADMIAW